MSATAARHPKAAAVTLGVTAAVAVVALLLAVDVVPPAFVWWTGVTTTALCTLGAVGLVWLGWRGALAEVAITGVVLLTMPLLELTGLLSARGIAATPGNAAQVAAAAAVPLAALAGTPVFLPDGRLRTVLAGAWRAWTSLWLGAVLLLAAALLWTSLRPPLPGSAVLAGATVVGAMLFAGIGWRHLSLYRVGRQRVSLLVGVTFLALGAVSLPTRVPGAPSSLALVEMAVDVLLSLVAIGGIALLGRRMELVPAVMAPIVTRDPLVALRLGLDPVVRGFVARVGAKDRGTRDHIVRVGELAMRVGLRGGIRGGRLRALGIGALLHDIGKLAVPDEVLRKPGALTDAEYELVKEHARAGERLLAPSPMLAASIKHVRWHHERPDGTGYPDGLTADQIPLDVAIVSVCDAYDAMTQDRHYRGAMTSERALAILDEHAGTQFDPAAVRLLRAELAASPRPTEVFASVGVGEQAAAAAQRTVCAHALPGGDVPGGARWSLGGAASAD